MNKDFPVSIFNSKIELATRASFILTCFFERTLDLDRLVFLDYALLYAKEFGGPLNLHTDLPNKIAEIIYRRETLPSALKLFISRGLILSVVNSEGVFFKASDNTPQYVACLKSEYYKNLWTNLFWLENNFELIDNLHVGYIHRSLQ